MLCHRLIGKQHKILDDPRRRIPLIRLYGNRNASLIQQYFAFRKVKVNGTPLFASLTQNVRQLTHEAEHGNQLPVFPDRLLILVLKDFFHRRIGHPPIHMDHGFHDLVIDHFPFGAYGHQAAQRKAVRSLV